MSIAFEVVVSRGTLEKAACVVAAYGDSRYPEKGLMMVCTCRMDSEDRAVPSRV